MFPVALSVCNHADIACIQKTNQKSGINCQSQFYLNGANSAEKSARTHTYTHTKTDVCKTVSSRDFLHWALPIELTRHCHTRRGRFRATLQRAAPTRTPWCAADATQTTAAQCRKCRCTAARARCADAWPRAARRPQRHCHRHWQQHQQTLASAAAAADCEAAAAAAAFWRRQLARRKSRSR